MQLDKKSEDETDVSKASKHLKKMSNDELEALLSSQDSFVIDCLLDQVPTVSTAQPFSRSIDFAIPFHNQRKLTFPAFPHYTSTR